MAFPPESQLLSLPDFSRTFSTPQNKQTKDTNKSRMHLPFVISRSHAFRQDANPGSCLLMISKKNRHLSRQDSQSTHPCQFKKQVNNTTTISECIVSRVSKYLAAAVAGICGRYGKMAMSTEAKSTSAELCSR